MCSLLQKRGLKSMPVHLGRALASVRAGVARRQGQSRTTLRSSLPQMVAPELEWELLRAVERAARRYRQAQRALADREAQGGGEAAFSAALRAVAGSHHQLDAALLEIQRYYEEAGVTVE